jgi:maltooligosyltrehalose trehalohydrolase
VHALIDTRATHILEEIANEVEARSAFLGRPLTLIAESDMNAPRLISPRAAGGYALSGQWSDDFHHAAHVALTREDDGYYEDFAQTAGHGLGALEKVLTHGFFHDGAMSTFRRRHHGRPLGAGTYAWRLVVSTQNHDQIGNRARGDRLSEKLTAEQLAVGATLMMCSPFTPMLFMGEEWGALTPFQYFSSHPEPELAEAVTKGRREEFSRMGWGETEVPDPQDFDTFRASRLDWMELDRPERQWLLDVYKRLIELRRTRPELTWPWLRDVSAKAQPELGVLSFWRGDLEVVCNFAAEPREVELDVDVAWTSHDDLPEVVFTTNDEVRVEGTRATLPAHCAAVFAPIAD